MLELKGVSYAEFGDTHIYPTDLVLQPGEFNNLLGATLAGKTTLMRLMAGLEPPGGGAILMNGKDVTGKSVRERDVAMVYQQFVNYPMMNVFDNIASPLRARGKAPADLKQRVGEVAELMRISELLQRKPHELSGGQQQRTAIARALVRHVGLVLLDEPLANLDYKLREELREDLPRLFAERGSIIVYATTEPGEALLLGGKTVALHEGRVAQVGPTAGIYHQPGTLLAARIFSDPPLNEMKVTPHDGAWQAGELGDAGIGIPRHGPLATLPEQPQRIAFRPHHLKLGPPPAGADWMSFTGEVIVTEISGSESFMHVRVGACEWVLQAHGVIDKSESAVELHISLNDMMVFPEAEHGAGVH